MYLLNISALTSRHMLDLPQVFQPAKAAAGLALLRRLLQQLTLLLGLSWAQSAAGDALSRGRLPAPLPACTWAITLPALVCIVSKMGGTKSICANMSL